MVGTYMPQISLIFLPVRSMKTGNNSRISADVVQISREISGCKLAHAADCLGNNLLRLIEVLPYMNHLRLLVKPIAF